MLSLVCQGNSTSYHDRRVSGSLSYDKEKFEKRRKQKYIMKEIVKRGLHEFCHNTYVGIETDTEELKNVGMSQLAHHLTLCFEVLLSCLVEFGEAKPQSLNSDFCSVPLSSEDFGRATNPNPKKSAREL